MSSYDVGVVLGNQVNPDGRFPDPMYRCLDRVAELYKQGVFPKLATAGNYAVEYDFVGKQPYPWKESDVSAEYLIDAGGIPPEVVLREGKSKDTLQNLVELKKLFKQHNLMRIFIVAPHHRATRIRWLAELVLGPEFAVQVDDTVPCHDKQAIAHEAFEFAKWQELLKDMTPGDDEWLEAQFFDGEIYQFWRTFAKEAAGRGLLAAQYIAPTNG